MPEDVHCYNLQFVYTDNKQVYTDCLKLTGPEKDELELALKALVEAGVITNPGGDGDTDEMLVPYRKPQFETLEQLKVRWLNGSLGIHLVAAGHAWEVKVGELA